MSEAGALAFGLVIGWFLYYVNRYRSGVAIADVAVIVAAIGGGVVLDLFPEGSVLFGFYGLGLAVGFFLYFGALIILVRINRQHGWTSEWFLDGRRPVLHKVKTSDTTEVDQQAGDRSQAMGDDEHDSSI